MIYKIFKISTKELWVLRNKKDLIDFIETQLDIYVSSKLKVKNILSFLPRENYYLITKEDKNER